MRTTELYGPRRDPIDIGPWLAFIIAVIAAAVVWAGLIAAIPAELAVPMAATLLFVVAGGVVLLPWPMRSEHVAQVTYADVAGALTLIGLCAAVTIDPEQLTRSVVSTSTQP